ncbi:ABC transporter substrate-binding protein [Thermococcus siculi]|nr:ABC transporter substrate-binding protein [Thermococcus siculi]
MILAVLMLGSLLWIPSYGASEGTLRSVHYGIASLGLAYYSSPEKLAPLMNLTNEELGELLSSGEYKLQNPVMVNYGNEWYKINQPQAIEGTTWVITVLDININENSALVVVSDSITGKQSDQTLLRRDVPVDIFGDGSIILTLKDTFVGIDGKLLALIEAHSKVSILRLVSKDQYWDLQKLGLTMGILDGVRIFLAEEWELYPVNKNRVSGIYALTRAGIDNRWSLMSASTPDGHLNVSFLTSDRLLWSPWNPLNSLDSNSYLVWSLVSDSGGYYGFDGFYHPYRCTWTVERGNFVVPNNAVIYNQTRGWISPNTGKNATVKITYHCDFGQWHNGISGGMDDLKNYIAFLYTWGYRDFDGDPYYDQLRDFWDVLPHTLGFQWLQDGYVVYGNYTHPIDDNVTAQYYLFYPQFPWELYWAIGELVANGQAYGVSNSYYFVDWKDGAQQLDLLNGTHCGDLEKVMSAIASGNAGASFPGINWGSAASRLNSDIAFYRAHGHFVISNGPYILAEYVPTKYIKLEKFTGSRTIFANYPHMPLTGNSNVIEFVPSGNFDSAVQEIARGNVDIGMFGFGWYRFESLGSDALQALELYPKTVGSFDLTVNPYHDPDKDAPIVTNASGVYFNPFAIREVRFALNYLVNRSYIVNNILGGVGTPMLGGISQTDPAYPYIPPVYRSLGLVPDGDIAYALALVERGMEKAQQEVVKYGHTLERRDDGFWYFDGQPVEVKFIIRIEDERHDIGLYVADLLEKRMGFRVKRLFWDRLKAGQVVFGKPPSNYEWNIYTGGWGTSGIEEIYPDGMISWWYSSSGYYPSAVGPNHESNITVEAALAFLGTQYGDMGTYPSAIQNASKVYFVFNNLGTPDSFSASQYISRTVPISVRTVSMLADEFNITSAGSSDVIVSVGGPLVNRITAKFDSMALVHMGIEPGRIRILTPNGEFIWNVPKPWWNVTEGYFVIQFFNDRTTGALVVTIYGTDADSTAAGAYYFMSQVYPNIDFYSGLNYMVGLWQDTETGADIPLPGAGQGDTSGFSAGDSITIVAQG